MGDVAGEITEWKNRDKTAYKYYEKALAIDSMYIPALNNYSYKLSEDSTQIDKALMLARRMMQQDTSNPTYLDTYAWILCKAGLTDEALKIMRQAISLDTTNSEVLLLHYGDILFESGQKYLARIYWRKALEAGADGKEIEIRIKKLEQ
jgi:tetratricopeptide (TPR) repeat protein